MEYQTRALITQAESILGIAYSIEVEDSSTLDTAAVYCSNMASLLKQIEAKRTEITAPLTLATRATNTLFSEITEPLKAADKTVRMKILTYQESERRRTEAARQEALNAARAAGTVVPMTDNGMVNIATGEVVDTPIGTVRTQAGSATFRETWTFEVTDPKLVPESYKIVNEKAIGAAVRGGVREIPGVRIYATSQLSVSGK